MTCFRCTCFSEAKGSNMKTRWKFESEVIYSLILYKPNKNQAIGCCKNQRNEQNNKGLLKTRAEWENTTIKPHTAPHFNTKNHSNRAFLKPFFLK